MKTYLGKILRKAKILNLKNGMIIPQKLNTKLPYDPPIPFLGLKKRKSRD